MNNSDPLIYYLPKQKLVYALSGVCAILPITLLILHFVFSGKYTGNSGSWIYAAVLFGFSAFLVFQWGYFSKLVISSNGIEVHNIFGSIQINWRILLSVSKIGSSICLLLKEPVMPTSRMMAWLISKSLFNSKIINISDYEQYWFYGNLKNDFDKYGQSLLISDDG
jgi:hypothetical protein